MQDSGRSAGHENRDLLDIELNGLLTELGQKTKHTTVILDSCHSGTATRDVHPAGVARSAPPDLRGKATAAAKSGAAVATRAVDDGSSGWRADGASYALIAAARSNEVSYERPMDGKSMGALTRSLTQALWKAGPQTTYRDVWDRVAIDVTSDFPGQHPQLEGLDKDSVLFGTKLLPPDPFVEVRMTGEAPELLAGGVQGITKGSTFAVYAPGTKDFHQAKALATVETEDVGAIATRAHITSGGPVIPDGARAIETQHHFTSVALRLRYMSLDKSATLRDAKSKLDTYGHIKDIGDSSEYDAQLRAADDGSILLEGGTPEPIGRPVAPGPGATDRIVQKVLALAKWESIKALDNESGFGGSAPWDVSLSSSPSAGSVAAGEPVTVILANHSNVRLYLSLLNLSFDGSVSQVYPAPGAAEFIEPSSTWNKPLMACLPKGRTEPIRDILKLFLTTEPTDFSFLEQQAVRSVPSPLERVVMALALGQSPRGIERPLAPDGWATKQISLVVDYAKSAKACDAQSQ
jgi:hypothetical protein